MVRLAAEFGDVAADLDLDLGPRQDLGGEDGVVSGRRQH